MSAPGRGASGHRIVACHWLNRDVDVEGQGGDRSDALGDLDVSAVEFDTIGGQRCAPFLVL